MPKPISNRVEEALKLMGLEERTEGNTTLKPLVEDKEQKFKERLTSIIQELQAQSQKEVVERAQRVIDLVTAGAAAEVGLEQAAALQALTYEFSLNTLKAAIEKPYSGQQERFCRLVNLHTKLSLQLKQSAAWSYREKNFVGKASGLGRNDSRVSDRILRRGTSTAEGCFDESL
ncbi:hypothetical protein ACM67B_09995 [Neisseria sp. CCUG17229]|uniref:hypothetical protein n=1 Tax=Neisseria sp. CCUG17229 TaxID=3392036 RepID=UPI003A103A99